MSNLFIIAEPSCRIELPEAPCHGAGLVVRRFDTQAGFLASYDPDREGCVVVSLRAGGPSGREVVMGLLRAGCSLPIVLVSQVSTITDAVAAIRSGAAEYLEHPAHPGVLLAAVRRALARFRELHPQRENARRVEAKIAVLTRRERDVLRLLVQGKRSKQIAAELGLTRKTTDAYRGAVMRKVGVSGLAELLIWYLEGQAPRLP